MKYESRWREQAAPIIREILMRMKDATEAEQNKALREAFPFGERKYHPYKIWLDEIQRQRGKKHPIGHKVKWENSQKRMRGEAQRLAEWERLYGKRQA